MFEIPIVVAGFSSAYDDGETVHDRLFDTALPAKDRWWSADNHSPQAIEGFFDGLYDVKALELVEMGSDQTTHHFACAMFFTREDGSFRTEPEYGWQGANIRRGGYGAMGFNWESDPRRWPIRGGFEKKRTVLPTLKLEFMRPVRSHGVRMIVSGHGWVGGRSLVFYGERVGDSALLAHGAAPTELPVVWHKPGFTG